MKLIITGKLPASTRTEGYEMEMRTLAKAEGGRWNPLKQLWFILYGKVAGTLLEKHIPVDGNDNNEKPKKHLYVTSSQASICISFHLQVDTCIYM